MLTLGHKGKHGYSGTHACHFEIFKELDGKEVTIVINEAFQSWIYLQLELYRSYTLPGLLYVQMS